AAIEDSGQSAQLLGADGGGDFRGAAEADQAAGGKVKQLDKDKRDDQDEGDFRQAFLYASEIFQRSMLSAHDRWRGEGCQKDEPNVHEQVIIASMVRTAGRANL